MRIRLALAAVLGVVTPLSIIAGIQWYGAAAAAGIATSKYWDGSGTALWIVILFIAINLGVLVLLGMEAPGVGKAPAPAPAVPNPPVPPTPTAEAESHRDIVAPPSPPRREVTAEPGDTVESLAMRMMEADRAAGADVNLVRARRRAAEELARFKRS